MEYILAAYLLVIQVEIISMVKQKKYKDLIVSLCISFISAIYIISYLWGFYRFINPSGLIELIFNPIVRIVFGSKGGQ